MDELKTVIAQNIQSLRKGASLTQGELAEKLNYSDKAVSKWERGESVPDVAVLKQIADLFGVTVDYLLTDVHDLPDMSLATKKMIRKNRTIITLLATTMVWLVATIAFALLGIILKDTARIWMCYIVAVPVSCIVLLVFNSIWGRGKLNFIIISVLMWSVLLTLYLLLRIENIWLIFVVGIPAQVIVFLWSHLDFGKKIIKR